MDEITKAQFENHEERLKKLENTSDSNKESLIEVKVQQKFIIDGIKDLTTAVNALKEKPAKEQSGIKMAIISSVASSVIFGVICFVAIKMIGG